MTTILYFFWTGFTEITAVVTVRTSPIIPLRGATDGVIGLKGSTDNVVRN